MAEKDGFEKFFGEKITSEDPFSMNTKKEKPDEFQDSEEEIIELTDPDDAPVAESEEEVIEPADFLEDLSMDEPANADRQESNIPPLEKDDDIIELTDTVEEPSTTEQKLNEISPSDENIPEDKDLFVFTDSEDEAVIADDDILSDTVFADEPSNEPDPHGLQQDQEPVVFGQEEEPPELQGGEIFDNTVLADESAGNDDDELAVLTEIDESPSQTEKEMFDDTVLSGEALGDGDEELAVLAEPQEKTMDSDGLPDTSAEFIKAPASSDSDSDMILLDETDTDASDAEQPFIKSDIIDSSESEQLEANNTADQDIADSLGMNLKQDIDVSGDVESSDSIEMTIEPVPEITPPEPELFSPETPATGGPDTVQVDQPIQSGPMEPAVTIPPDQLEATVGKVIRKMFGDKIDSIIIDVIEKTVRADIEKIKKELLKSSMEDL